MVMQSRNSNTSQYDGPFPTFPSPLRGLGSSIQSSAPSSSEVRASLQRRFTTNVLPTAMTLSAIGQQRRQGADLVDPTIWHIKKQQDIETARASRDNFQAAMAAVAQLDPLEKAEILRRMDLGGHYSVGSGHQSEPTTPPEYRDNSLPNVFSRTNRYSSASMASPPGLSNRPSRSGSQITSTPSELGRIFSPMKHVQSNVSHMPSKSMPGSRRNSDEDESYVDEIEDFTQRSQNRISMPVTASDLRGRTDIPDFTSVLGHVNTTRFLFDDDEDKLEKSHRSILTSPEVKNYLQMKTTKDNFPMLISSGQDGSVSSPASAALDLASTQSSVSGQSNGWPPIRGHRAAPSLPADAFASSNASNTSATLRDIAKMANASNRRSLEVKFDALAEYKRPSLLRSPPSGAPKLQSSYSTNDIPTIRNVSAMNGLRVSGNVTPNAHVEQGLHSHNASLGHIPLDTFDSRHSRERSIEESMIEEPISTAAPAPSALQASATPFGPTSGNTMPNRVVSEVVLPSATPIGDQALYGGYGMQMLSMGVGNMLLGHPPQWNNPMQQIYQGAYGAYQPYQQYSPGANRVSDSQSRVVQQRRVQSGEDTARFANTPLEKLKGEIYGLCKDQHGCRFLQKKLEDRKPESVELIFEEVNEHVIELMTDPFGNYLCQKLLEYTNDGQRTVLINNAAPQMVKIALNQHGTRALQKMIDFISTQEQIQTVTIALQNQVVQLIQDLNGNHVIQKCLNRLSPEDAQFIFDAVGANCVVVGTHRHGCCVLQRCIDHASGYQKAQLIEQITANAFALVQDPFGNYVVQYILDLGEPSFARPLCEKFLGSIAALSRQKFSSNVIEKCIRTADPEVKRKMIDEMINPVDLERLLRDAYANYVVQTAMDYADPDTKTRLVESIRPILPAIRQTPYGRRIQSKIQDRDGLVANLSAGQISPHGSSTPGQLAMGIQSGQTYHHHNNGQLSNPFNAAGNSIANPGIALYNTALPSNGITPASSAPDHQAYGNANAPTYYHGSNYVQQPLLPYGRQPQRNGMSFY